MQVLRSLATSLLTFLCVVSLSLLIYIATLNMTVLNRTIVKQWLVDSGIYKANLLPSTLGTAAGQTAKSTTPGQAQLPQISPSALTSVLEKTFPPSYVQTQSETIIDTFYDWFNGTSPTFALSIPINERRDVFATEMAHVVEPQIAALPVCTTRSQPANLCRPSNVSTTQMAQTLVQKNIDDTHFFDKPLMLGTTPETTSPSAKPLQAPQVGRYITPLTIILLVILTLSIIGIISLAPATGRLITIVALGKRIFFSQIINLILALVGLWLLSGALPITPPGGLNEAANSAFIHLIRLVGTSIAGWAALFSGLACAAGLGAWVGGKALAKRQTTTGISA